MNLLTMIPILDDKKEVVHFVGFQVDLVENPQAVNSTNPDGTYQVNYQRDLSIPPYLMSIPGENIMSEYGQTIPRDEVTTVLGTLGTGENELSKRIMDKVLLENADDVIHVLSLKGLFLYLSPSCRKVLEYDVADLVGKPLSNICHPSDIIPVTRELKDTQSGAAVSVVFRIRRKRSGYMWFESHGSLHTEHGKGRKCIILVGRERPVYTLSRKIIESAVGIGENEMWTKLSTTGMFLFVSSNTRFLLDRQPEELVGTNIQSLMRPDSKQEFNRVLTLALMAKDASVRHEMTNRRGQVLQAYTWLYPGDSTEGHKPTFIIAQTRFIKYHRGSTSNRVPGKQDAQSSADSMTITSSNRSMGQSIGNDTPISGKDSDKTDQKYRSTTGTVTSKPAGNSVTIGRQDASLISEDNAFDELKPTRSTSWQYELRQMEKQNRVLAEEVQSLLASKKKRKRRRGAGLLQKDCANCHTKSTPEWRRGPSGNRDLCNSCGLRWAKQVR
jgi:PAS domain S-box-containing protein